MLDEPRVGRALMKVTLSALLGEGAREPIPYSSRSAICRFQSASLLPAPVSPSSVHPMDVQVVLPSLCSEFEYLQTLQELLQKRSSLSFFPHAVASFSRSFVQAETRKRIVSTHSPEDCLINGLIFSRVLLPSSHGTLQRLRAPLGPHMD